MSDDLPQRQQILATCLQLNTQGLNQGTSGNISVRQGQGMLITPSGRRYDQTQPDELVYMDLQGRYSGSGRPSSEWRFHRDILAQRPDINAIIHTHSTFATTLACLGRDVPAFHYMIAMAGGNNIRCAPYATFGSQALSDYAVEALRDRYACLLGNHGLIVAGADLDAAFALLVEVEKLCEIYWRTLQVGPPQLLDDGEMARVQEKFRDYKKRH